MVRRFKCIVQHDGVFDARAMAYETEELWFDIWEHGGKTYYEDPQAYEKWNPVNYVANWKTPMLVVTSEHDFRIPYTQGIAAFTALQMRDIPAELLVFPDENHWVLKPKNSLQWHNTVFSWLAALPEVNDAGELAQARKRSPRSAASGSSGRYSCARGRKSRPAARARPGSRRGRI